MKKKIEKNIELIKKVEQLKYDISIAPSNEEAKLKYEELKNLYMTHVVENNTRKEFKKIKRYVSGKTIIITILLSTFISLLIGILINYLFYIPKINGPINWSSKETISSLIISFVLFCFMFIFGYTYLKKIKYDYIFELKKQHFKKGIIIGFFGNILDVLGVGSYTPTIAYATQAKIITDDKKIGGTLSVGYAIPIITQALFFTTSIEVDPVTLIMFVICSVIGAWFGAAIIVKHKLPYIKPIIAVILFGIAILMIFQNPLVNLIPNEGNLIGFDFDDWRLYIGCIVFILLGIVMQFGIGTYPPALAILSSMGFSVEAAFPIMMCGNAFMSPVAAIKYFKSGHYEKQFSWGMTIGGVFGVIFIYLLFFVLLKGVVGIDPTTFDIVLKWLVVFVLFYTSAIFMYDFIKSRGKRE